MLKTRLLTAAVLIPAVLAALFLLPSKAWALFTLLITGAAAYEWARLVGFAMRGALVFVASTLAVGLWLLLSRTAGFAAGFPEPTVLVLCGAAALFWLLLAPPWVVARWPTKSRLPMVPLGWIVLLGAWVALVELQSRSPWLVLAAMAVVWIADTAAYFSGKAFGRHKLAPNVSPGKTWEGVYGAWAAVGLYALLLVPYAAQAGLAVPISAATVAIWLLFVLVLTSVSVVGDLFESLLKRHAGVKDSGASLPGHGGVLDRTDALFAAMPIVAVAAQLFLTGPV